MNIFNVLGAHILWRFEQTEKMGLSSMVVPLFPDCKQTLPITFNQYR